MKRYAVVVHALTSAATLLLTACATPVAPSGASSPAGIAWDGNQQDAGIDAGTSAGLPCSQDYHDRYMAWLPVYGSAANAPAQPFTPVDVAGARPWLITGAGAAAYMAMNRAHKLNPGELK